MEQLSLILIYLHDISVNNFLFLKYKNEIQIIERQFFTILPNFFISNCLNS